MNVCHTYFFQIPLCIVLHNIMPILLFSLFLSTDKMDAVFISDAISTGEYERMYHRTFSTSYQSYPNIKIMYSGNNYQSWIDIIVSYSEISNNNSHQNKYYYQSISESDRTISMIPYAKDKLLVFNFDERLNEISVSLTSHKKFRMLHRSNFFNFVLTFTVPLHVTQDSVDRQVACQGEIIELTVNSECKTSKNCPELTLYWIPDQLNKYKDYSQKKPHNCFIQNFRMTDKMYCLNFSSNSRILNYIYITGPPSKNQVLHELFDYSLISWDNASYVCQHMGGSLPIIRSKSEMDEFIALILFSEYIPPQYEIFIGLSTTISKV